MESMDYVNPFSGFMNGLEESDYIHCAEEPEDYYYLLKLHPNPTVVCIKQKN